MVEQIHIEVTVGVRERYGGQESQNYSDQGLGHLVWRTRKTFPVEAVLGELISSSHNQVSFCCVQTIKLRAREVKDEQTSSLLSQSSVILLRTLVSSCRIL